MFPGNAFEGASWVAHRRVLYCRVAALADLLINHDTASLTRRLRGQSRHSRVYTYTQHLTNVVMCTENTVTELLAGSATQQAQRSESLSTKDTRRIPRFRGVCGSQPIAVHAGVSRASESAGEGGRHARGMQTRRLDARTDLTETDCLVYCAV